ncbi:MAG TPA: N-acetyltransferase [Pararhizobium sp.]|uniref:GNAT family N-acetyltransferase n=1 Tax=Pararhizobium sp. TaxID=1977563 RepID=UPI002B9AFD10|nr:N-acetyltransferase [Pararhizobium sp.]HTO30977.1 N-acetyltransferase [Pararhizobium sp.]
MIIRPETAGDIIPIRALTTIAFAGMPYSDGTEAAIIDRLRADGALVISLVAEIDDVVVGHVAFSPVEVADGADDWFGLGPVSVDPDRQKGGIGMALIKTGLDRLREIGAAGCVLLGDPGYYERFGFRHYDALRFPGPPPEYFLALTLRGSVASGIVQYHKAFYGAAA